MEDLESLGLRPAEYPSPRLELLMEELEKFGFETGRILPGLELLMEDLESLGSRLEEYPSPRIATSHG